MRTCVTCGAVWDDAYDLCSYDGGILDESFKGPRVFGDRYLLEQRVAAGAMGVVFRATHLQLGSTVAVKLMQPQKEELVVGLARFHREGQILGQIKHPHAVLVVDFGVEQREHESFPYLVTEFLQGEGLDAFLAREAPLPLAEVARILIPLCEAVHEAHEIGVIHRDLKPSNVFLEKLRDGSTIVKVLDFGIAKFVEIEPKLLDEKRRDNAEWALRYGKERADFLDEVAQVRRTGSDTGDVMASGSTQSATQLSRRQHASNGPAPDGEKPGARASAPGVKPAAAPAAPLTVTEVGFMVGTIPYMAPEQMTGERICRQTDVYAIATLAFQMLTGVLPFEGDDDAIIQQKLSNERPSPLGAGAAIPSELDDILRVSLAGEPGERPANALEIAAAFSSAVPPVVDDSDDPAFRLSIQVGAAIRILLDIEHSVTEHAVNGGDHATYATARDRLLALPGPLARALQLSVTLPSPLDTDARRLLESSATELEDASLSISRALAHLGRGTEAADFLVALWSRSLHQVDELERLLERQAPRPAPAPISLPALVSNPANPFAPEADQRDPIGPLVARLMSRESLDAADALDDLLRSHLAEVHHALAAPSPLPELVPGLWRHADQLLVAELYGVPPPRLLPLLAASDDDKAAGFGALARVFASPIASADEVEAARDVIEHEDERVVFDRCLLLHPSNAVREDAIARLPLSSLWPLLLSDRLPLDIIRLTFSRALLDAKDEFLKVFFLCVKDAVGMATDAHLQDAFALMRLFFSVDCFHEDVVFEPLLDLDRGLTDRARAVRHDPNDGTPADGDYAELSAAFVAGGARDTRTESLRDIPLAVQRKLAREGLFIDHFMTHPVDKVALETVPHLLRRDDVTRFLRVPTIHRGVLTELAKVRRLFRKDQARLALLQNPKTPANVARIYLPLLPHVQVQNLSRNKHIGAEVRGLAQTFADKLAMRTESGG